MARRQRGADGVERVREGARDVAVAEEVRDALDVVGDLAQPVEVVGRQPQAQHVHGLRLALEAGGQLDGEEDVGAVGDGQDAVDRVVVGDRHEVHPAALGQLVDLLGRRRALGQPEGALDPRASRPRTPWSGSAGRLGSWTPWRRFPCTWALL